MRLDLPLTTAVGDILSCGSGLEPPSIILEVSSVGETVGVPAIADEAPEGKLDIELRLASKAAAKAGTGAGESGGGPLVLADDPPKALP